MDNELCLQVRLDGQAHSKLRCLSDEDGRSFEEIVLDCFRERYLRVGPAAPLRSLRASYKPQTHRRQAPLVPNESALLFIDLQNYNCSRRGALYTTPGKEASSEEYWWREVAAATPRWMRLRNECKRAGIEVIQSLTADGRDRSLDYKISGFHVPPGSYDAQVLDCIAPGGDDIVLPKTSASVFISTSLDYILRCLGKRQIVISGALTDQCVEGAVRDACDLNYLVTLVSDACVTMSCERHESSLRAVAGFCRQRTTDELVAELAAAAASAGC